MELVSEYDGKRQTHVVGEDLVIGRKDPASTADLQLESDKSISRRHARLWMKDDAPWIEDLGSSWGTMVNGRKITASIMLGPDDEIQLGDTIIGFRQRGQSSTIYLRVADVEGQKEVPVDNEMLPENVSVSNEMKPAEASMEVMQETQHLTKKQLALLYEMPLHFSGEPNSEALAKLILERVVKIVPNGRRGAVLLRNKTSNKFTISSSIPAGTPPVSNTLVQRCVARKVGFIWSREEETDPTKSMSSLGLASGIYAPIMWLEQVVGVVCVDNPSATAEFTEQDLSFIVTVANYAGAAISNLMLREELTTSIAMSQKILDSFARSKGK